MLHFIIHLLLQSKLSILWNNADEINIITVLDTLRWVIIQYPLKYCHFKNLHYYTSVKHTSVQAAYLTGNKEGHIQTM